MIGPRIAIVSDVHGSLTALEAVIEELGAVYGGSGHDLVAYGHIHRPYTRSVDGLAVVNCGSVGMSWDGDPRAAYVLVDAGAPQVIRVDYGLERDVSLLRRSGHPDADRLAEIRRSGRFVPPTA